MQGEKLFTSDKGKKKAFCRALAEERKNTFGHICVLKRPQWAQRMNLQQLVEGGLQPEHSCLACIVFFSIQSFQPVSTSSAVFYRVHIQDQIMHEGKICVKSMNYITYPGDTFYVTASLTTQGRIYIYRQHSTNRKFVQGKRI